MGGKWKVSRGGIVKWISWTTPKREAKNVNTSPDHVEMLRHTQRKCARDIHFFNSSQIVYVL